MLLEKFDRRASFVVLCVSLVVVTVLFGVREQYTPGISYALAFVQITVMSLAAWNLGLFAIRVKVEERRTLAVAGALLIMPWVLFSLLAGVGPPGQGQTPAESRLRYLILLINAIAVGGGLLVLRQALSVAGERFHSALGSAAIVLATPLYLIWATILLEAHTSADLTGSTQLPPWANFQFEMADTLLFFGGSLTYLATAAFVMSLGRTQWLGRTAARALVIASLFSLLCLSARGLQFPDPAEVFKHWYAVPGYVVGIPAVPWIMPCLLGIVLLRRAGDLQRQPLVM